MLEVEWQGTPEGDGVGQVRVAENHVTLFQLELGYIVKERNSAGHIIASFGPKRPRRDAFQGSRKVFHSQPRQSPVEVTMRNALSALMLLTVLVSGCGSDSSGPSVGTLNVRFDANSCTAGNAEVFVDGASMGVFFWTPGVTRPFTVAAGTRLVGASNTNHTLVWPNQSTNVPSGGEANVLFNCQ